MSSADQVFDQFERYNKDISQAYMLWGNNYFNMIDSLIKFWRQSSSFFMTKTTGTGYQ